MGDLASRLHLLIVAIIVLVFFGGRKLPETGKGLGEGLRGFKDGMKEHHRRADLQDEAGRDCAHRDAEDR